MTITINEELRAYIDPLTVNEYQALENSILTEGCRDALVLWGELLIDGHNRHAICTKHGIEFKTVQNTRFTSMEDVKLWMIDNHLARRSVSDFQRGILALRKKEIVAARRQQTGATTSSAEIPETTSPMQTREEVAKVAGISSNTVVQIEKIQRAATPELVAAVRAGTISINAAATVATLPQEQQIAAVAGGKKELQQAAKQVREMRSGNKVASPKEAPEEIDLNEKITALKAENHALKNQVAELTLALDAAIRASGPDAYRPD
jgi:transcriptional regulator with XRE-family HTH domain